MTNTLFWLLVSVALTIWVYTDAKARDANHPILWTVGAFLLTIVVVPIWLITRGPKSEAASSRIGIKSCPFCAEDIKDAAIVCRHCGKDLPVVTVSALPKYN